MGRSDRGDRSGCRRWCAIRAGQSVTLTLPDGLTFAEGHGATSPVAAGKTAGYAQVNWLVVPKARLEGERELVVRLSPDAVDSRRDNPDRAGRLDALNREFFHSRVPCR